MGLKSAGGAWEGAPAVPLARSAAAPLPASSHVACLPFSPGQQGSTTPLRLLQRARPPPLPPPPPPVRCSCGGCEVQRIEAQQDSKAELAYPDKQAISTIPWAR